jgi:hypothetical protein
MSEEQDQPVVQALPSRQARSHRRSWAEAERLITEFEASGLSRREFCRKAGLALGTLDLYRKSKKTH